MSENPNRVKQKIRQIRESKDDVDARQGVRAEKRGYDYKGVCSRKNSVRPATVEIEERNIVGAVLFLQQQRCDQKPRDNEENPHTKSSVVTQEAEIFWKASRHAGVAEDDKKYRNGAQPV
jgi:hypothetical protein